jgi:hypothetical protein
MLALFANTTVGLAATFTDALAVTLAAALALVRRGAEVVSQEDEMEED